ncbi:MAG: EAL domain-containing protein [Deltaproteobacteria bacterium]
MKTPGSDHARASSGRVLFVDDDTLCARAFRRSLVRRGYAVDIATTASEALSLARRFHYAVIATDLMMPDADGLDIIRRIRSLQPDAAYLMITGKTDLRLPDTEEAGMISQIVYKPWDDKMLIQAISSASNRHAERIADRFVALATVDESQDAHVLLVEDDPTDAARVRRALKRAGPTRYIVTHVERLSDAMTLLGESSFDLVLLDLTLPDARGLTAIAMVHATVPNTPILVVSGMNAESIAYQSVQIGAEDHLVKDKVDDASLVRAMRFAIERNRARDRIAYLSNFNALTGLPNRSTFREKLGALLHAPELDGREIGVLMFDLDGFRNVNSVYSADVGDAVLREIGERLRAEAKKTEFVAHLAGDEFAVIVDHIDNVLDLEDAARRILKVVTMPMRLGASEVMTTASAGACAAALGDDADEVIRNAEEAMLAAKRSGRGRFAMHRREVITTDLGRLSLEADLANALGRDEFVVYYQPKIDTRAGRVVGLEALIRWQHEDRGLVPPGEFIPLLEETGLIVPVGEWVLETACRQLETWQTRMEDPDLSVAVNIAARQLRDPMLVEQVWRSLSRLNVNPKTVELELTESALIDGDDALERLQALGELGVTLAVDDFGTGYSSLAYLERFPVDVLKIDRAFVGRCDTNDSSRSLTNAIILLARALELDVVAEGAETQAQVDLLSELGCDVVQGYYFAKPMPASVCGRWLDDFSGRRVA